MPKPVCKCLCFVFALSLLLKFTEDVKIFKAHVGKNLNKQILEDVLLE